MYWLNPNQSTTNECKSFVCDTVDDIQNLPTSEKWGVEQDYKYTDPQEVGNKPVAIGSDCLVIMTGDVYMLKSDNQWAPIGG